MSVGKYYCDYCSKQFQDTPAARKRHLQGLQHLRAKAQWFHSLNANDPNHSLTKPSAKGVCIRFLKMVNIPLFSQLFWVYWINSIRLFPFSSSRDFANMETTANTSIQRMIREV
ncbi:hypothetical protein CRYUN_Cryun16bG0002400 [Craigia yunnanensis]